MNTKAWLYILVGISCLVYALYLVLDPDYLQRVYGWMLFFWGMIFTGCGLLLFKSKT